MDKSIIIKIYLACWQNMEALIWCSSKAQKFFTQVVAYVKSTAKTVFIKSNTHHANLDEMDNQLFIKTL